MKNYKVTCLKCGKYDVAEILEDAENPKIFFKSGMATNFLAGRWRGDRNWGFECLCGNDNRLGASEVEFFDQLVKGTPKQVADIKASLEIPDKTQFTMVAV